MKTQMAVYRLLDAEDALLYVGVSEEFGRRWRQHASEKPWWPEVRRQTVEWHSDEDSAVAAELKAINEENPRYNVAKTNNHYRSSRTAVVVVPQNILGTHEIAVMFDVSRQRAQQITARKDFPRPYDVLHMGKVWRRKAVEQWAQDHGRTVAGDTPPAT